MKKQAIIMMAGVALIGSRALAQTNVDPTWKIIPPTATTVLDKSWFSSSDNTTRGMAYNSATNHLLVVDRTPSNSVYILNATTGADFDTLNLTGVTGGGGAVINKIGVAGDGAIYMCNLDTSNNFKIYRWASEDSGRVGSGNTAPTVAYQQTSGDDPGSIREGDGFAVIGSGTGTKILAVGSTTNVSVFTTTDGSTFTRALITPGITANSSQHIYWDPDGVHAWWHNPNVTNLIRIDTSGGSSVTFSGVTSLFSAASAATVPSFSSQRWVLITPGSNAATGNPSAQLYKITDPTTAGALPTASFSLRNAAAADSLTSGSANANGNGSGESILDPSGTRAWVLYTNNSITMYSISGLSLPVELDTFEIQ